MIELFNNLKESNGDEEKMKQYFVGFHLAFLGKLFGTYPVRNIMNFSTFVKSPGKDSPSETNNIYNNLENIKTGTKEESKTLSAVLGKEIQNIFPKTYMVI